MAVAAINCFNVPIEIAIDPPMMKNILYQILLVLTDIIFLGDIVVNFNTTYELEDGSIIYERKLIAKRYLQTGFTIDLLSAIPLDLMMGKVSRSATGKRLKLISLLKLFRMLRLSKLIRKLNVAREHKIKLKLLKMMIQVILYLHCCACMWFYIIEFD